MPSGELVEKDGQTFWRVEYVRRKGSGLTYTPKRSFTLEGDFVPMAGSVVVTPIDDEFERVVVSEPCDPAVVPRCFGFVEVAAP